MEYVATERIYEPINDDGAAVLVYAEGAIVAEADVERYPDKVALAEADEQEPGGVDEFEAMTRDQLLDYFNEHKPEGSEPLPKGSRKADALSAVRSLA